ncbi:MAG: hypothetical protein ACK5TY_02950 [Verrucomicrobiota bacterium]
MNRYTLLLSTLCLASLQHVQADLTIPGDGSDGALNITEYTVIDLSKAVTGKWDQNNAANAGHGVYDPEKWAIVFKYSSVNIAAETAGVPSQLVGRTLRFTNHPSRAPVVWLVQGDVVINGIVSLRGEGTTRDSVLMLTPREPGPGGFRGGAFGPSGSGTGYGPGGQADGSPWGAYLGSYGNPQIIPLIGGSGSRSREYWGSAAGGGAILIAASGSITVNGIIDARGGAPGENVYPAADGAIKLIGSSVTGNGTLDAPFLGRIRVETVSPMAATLKTFPETIGVPPADPPILWPAGNAPKARIVSVDAVPAPEDPKSPVVAAADLAIQNNAPVSIIIETLDFPIEGVVQLAVIPKFGQRGWLTATRVSGDITKATWRVITTLPQGFVTLQARATQP